MRYEPCRCKTPLPKDEHWRDDHLNIDAIIVRCERCQKIISVRHADGRPML